MATAVPARGRAEEGVGGYLHHERIVEAVFLGVARGVASRQVVAVAAAAVVHVFIGEAGRGNGNEMAAETEPSTLTP